MHQKLTHVAVRTCVLYAVIGALWILLSDKVLDSYVTNPTALNTLQTYKGWLFVAVTALLLYLTLRTQLRRWEAEAAQRRRAEIALRESEERFRTILYSIGDGVIITDSAGTISHMNRIAEELTGWKETEALRKPIQEVYGIVDEKSNAPAEQAVHRALQEGVLVDEPRPTMLVDRKGGRRPITDTAAPIRTPRNDIVGAALVFRDESERKELQSQLIQAQKMEAIGRLAGGVAHDFNNMIGVMLGYAVQIRDKLGLKDPLRSHAATIVAAAERSANLTRQLLAFARKQIIAPTPLDLNEAIFSLQKMLARLIGEDVALNLIPGRDLWTVRIDPTQVDQILANLSANARDAIDDVGTVTIETRNSVIEPGDGQAHMDMAPGEYVILSFSDTGRGIESSLRDHVFEPFFTTKEKGEGTGLGLATVFGIVKQNKGFIDLSSEPGEGSTFTIYFPRCIEGTRHPAVPESDGPLQGAETILVVEDDEDMLDLAGEVLRERGYSVLTARTPQDALRLCRETAKGVHLLLADVVLPGMNGRELKGRLDLLAPGMKTLYMSGYTADIVAQRNILEAGVNFLQKPFTPSMLAKKVRDVLDG